MDTAPSSDDDDDEDDGNDLSEDCGAVHYCLGGEVYGVCLYAANHPGKHYCSTCGDDF